MQLTDYQRQVLGVMRPKPISLGSLRRAIGFAGSERALRQLLMRMADKGLIERTGDWGYIATTLGRANHEERIIVRHPSDRRTP